MKVLSVTSELFPLVKTGGLADVTGALPKALSTHGVETRTLLPGYPRVLERLGDASVLAELTLLGVKCRLLCSEVEGLELYVLDSPDLYDRRGGLYVDENGFDYPDNWKRFAALSLAGALLADGELDPWRPHVVHAHDWQAAMTPVYLRHKLESTTPTMLTIHNLAFQGQFSFERLGDLQLPSKSYDIGCLEYYGSASFLKAGIQTSDIVTTVSPTYAREILSETLGMGMEGVLRANRSKLKGIVNGIDTEVWNPAKDSCLVATFDTEKLTRRALNRQHLTKLFDFGHPQGPVFAVVSRLTWQKGIDLLIEAVPHLVQAGGRLIVCGQGDRDLQDGLANLAKEYPEKVAVSIGYNEGLAHLIFGGSDFLIQPSRFEPCGLTQLYALRYGAIPIVGRTGGLSETIIDANDAATAIETATGIQFHPVNTDELKHAIDRAFEIHEDHESMRKLQRHGMSADFTWQCSARRYARMFHEMSRLSPRIVPLSVPPVARRLQTSTKASAG